MRSIGRLSLLLLPAACLQGSAASAPSQGRLAGIQMDGKSATVYTTADSTSLRLTPTDTLTFRPSEPTSEGKVYIFVDPRKTFQTLIGIGGALTDAAA